MMRRPVTLRRIESEGRDADKRAAQETCASYLAKYGIRNVWANWLMRQDSRLCERRREDFCAMEDEIG